MKRRQSITATLALCGMLLSCSREFKNPSDPRADDYSVRSRAVLNLIDADSVFTGDTVRVFGGISSPEVEEESLVRTYQWDFDDDGDIDTVLDRSDTLWFIPDSIGTVRLRLVLKDRARYLDSTRLVFDVHQGTTVAGIDLGDYCTVVLKILTSRPVFEGVRTRVAVALGCNTLDIDSLNLRFRWDFDGDGRVDTVTTSADTLSITWDSAGSYQPTVEVAAGNDVVLSEESTVVVFPADTGAVIDDSVAQPDPGVYLPHFPTIPEFPGIDERECAFFAEDSSLIRTSLDFYDIMWRQTSEDGLEALEFVEQLLLDMLGYAVITIADADYTYSFSNGVYVFSADSFEISCAFHYGSGIAGRTENDTIRHNLFKERSYIRDPGPSLTPPYFTYTEGPLFELLQGDLDVNTSTLEIDYSLNFARIKVSFLRRSVYSFAALPFYVVNDSLRLNTTHRSFARMAPVTCADFGSLFHNDSIVLDHRGTTMESSPVALEVVFREGDDYKTATYRYGIGQEMLRQQAAYGDRDDILKLSGDFETVGSMDFNALRSSIFFRGDYSSTASDSSWFYCDSAMTDEFGALFFGVIGDSVGQFLSEKYGYSFPWTPRQVHLGRYRTLLE